MEERRKLNDVFAENLLYYLELNHMSQKKLAESISVSTSLVSDWSLGKKFPRGDNLNAICDVFKITMSDLTDKRDSPSDNDKLAVSRYIGNNEDVHRIIKSCKKLSADSLKSLADFLESK